jgi:hypothetical protein
MNDPVSDLVYAVVVKGKDEIDRGNQERLVSIHRNEKKAVRMVASLNAFAYGEGLIYSVLEKDLL